MRSLLLVSGRFVIAVRRSMGRLVTSITAMIPGVTQAAPGLRYRRRASSDPDRMGGGSPYVRAVPCAAVGSTLGAGHEERPYVPEHRPTEHHGRPQEGRTPMAMHPYPVTYDVQRPERYNRLTVAFRLILAIPHLILVGAGGLHLAALNAGTSDPSQQGGLWVSNVGVLTALLGVLVFFAWVAILWTGRFPTSLRDVCLMLFRWAQNVHAYVYLLTDEYPPFGDKPYPVRLTVEPTARHHRLSVAFRLILVIPHAVVLFFLGIGQSVVTVIAWFAILFTGEYPAGLYAYSLGVARWQARVGAYLYLFVDEYPPFTLAAEPGADSFDALPA